MKKYCNCNKPGLNDYDNYDGIIVEDNANPFKIDYKPEKDIVAYTPYPHRSICLKCNCWHWYRAHEENMMFDLKSMNN